MPIGRGAPNRRYRRAVSPNPAAIAWYLQRSESLLEELHERVQSSRIRGGQIAGFAGAVLALVGANTESIIGSLNGLARGCAGVSLSLAALLLVASLAVALRGTRVPRRMSDVSVDEVANYDSERFMSEPDLWRVHLRTIRGLVALIESTTRQCDRAALAVRRAENIFLVGLLLVGVALATLTVTVTF